MTTELIKKLLEAGVHFGHQTRRWNPKMKKFIFGDRGGIYIIDLEKTADCLDKARDFAREIASKGGRFLFIGTKKQAQEVVQQEAIRSGMFHVSNRWMGGLLTNFETVKKSIRKLQDIERMEKDGTFDKLTKKEISLLNKERERLVSDLGGIREMTQSPDAVFLVDVKKEENAVRECMRLNIPIIAMIDTNSDPDPIAYPIPANDDAVKSIRLLASLLTDSIIEGRREYLGSDKAKERGEAPLPEPVVDIPVPAVIAESLSEELDVYEEVVATTAEVDNKKKAAAAKKAVEREK
ncbi:MAG: 30S ribosomal protein S2 [Candidatus Omnitrophica bacterium]|nr:30S ribosomal protein S2 [Candidatus Omnitrophota bacterium]